MSPSLLNILVLVFIVAQFVPQGQVFLASDKGALATVAIAALALFSMLGSILVGNVISILFGALWVYIAWKRVDQAKSYVRRLVKR